MKEKQLLIIASAGLLVGGILGIAGSFAPSDSLRTLLWGLDGTSLIVAGALLVIYCFRKGHDATAAGFLVFTIGEALILSSSALNRNDNLSSFGAGTALWSASLPLVSSQRVFPIVIRCIGFIASILFAVVSVKILLGHSINALTEPLPFYAYPFFAITLFGWAWKLLRTSSLIQNQ